MSKTVDPDVAELLATISRLQRDVINLEIVISSAESQGDYCDWDFIRAMHPDVNWTSIDA